MHALRSQFQSQALFRFVTGELFCNGYFIHAVNERKGESLNARMEAVKSNVPYTTSSLFVRFVCNTEKLLQKAAMSLTLFFAA